MVARACDATVLSFCRQPKIAHLQKESRSEMCHPCTYERGRVTETYMKENRKFLQCIDKSRKVKSP